MSGAGLDYHRYSLTCAAGNMTTHIGVLSFIFANESLVRQHITQIEPLNKNVKPDSSICPRQFCFHWALAGDKVDETRQEYDSFDEACAGAETVVTTDRCACVFGKCNRNMGEPGPDDQYEPSEDLLKEAGLPWFFFVASKDNLTPEMWGEYEREGAGSVERTAQR